MRGRLLFIVGIVAGYVVGSRSGRPAYDALMARLRGAAADPRVQEAGQKAKEAFEDRAPKAAETVAKAADAASKVAETTAAAGSAAKQAGDDADAAGDTSEAPSTAPTPGV